MRLFKQSSTNQEDTASHFERAVLAVANDESSDLAQLTENGHSAFYNLFNETIEHYGDHRHHRRAEVK